MTEPPPLVARRRLWGYAATAALLLLAVAGGLWWHFARASAVAPSGAGELEIYMVDVGQGDAFIIQSPGGKTYIVDAGSDAEATVIPQLRQLGVTRLAAILVTHPHQDHIGGVPDLLKRYPVDTLYDCGYVHTARSYRETLRLAREKGVAYDNPQAGDVLDWDGLKIEIMHPDRPTYENLNDNSIVFLLTYGATTMLFTGDAEAAARKAILARFRNRVPAQVLKLAHHGSSNGTTGDWLELVRPDFGLISCGLDNRFRHPHQPVLDLLRQRDIATFRSDRQGTVRLVSDGQRWTVAALGKTAGRLPSDAGAEQ